MKSSEFIAKIARNEVSYPKNGRRYVSSILFDGRHAYSYGTHYPLLMKIETKSGRTLFICNDRGYSSSTGRHISYAQSVADYSVHFFSGKQPHVDTVRMSAQEEIARIDSRSVALAEELKQYPRRAIRIARETEHNTKRKAHLEALLAALDS